MAATPVSPPSARGDRRLRMAAAPVSGSASAVGAAPRVGLIYDERMLAHATPGGEYHPENPERLRAVWSKLAAEGITSRCLLMTAKEAHENSIASVHSPRHIKLIKNISSKKKSYRNRTAEKLDSIYFNEGSSESAFLAAGSVTEVTEKVAAGELNSAIALTRPPGHHAEHDKAMGFCLFNNVAIGADYLLNERPDLGIKKIFILDWDAHHGNGTQKMFYNDPRVLVFSVHPYDNAKFYPCKKDASHTYVGERAGKGYNINVPWEHEQCGDADYLAVWKYILLPVIEAFDPDIVLLSAGFDSALGDPLGGCCITPNGYALLLTKLIGFAKGKIVMALEGGYDLESLSNSVAACAKVLLGDTLEFNTPQMQVFESTWTIIQMVRDELKEYWTVLSSKLPENVPLRSYKPDMQLNVEQVVLPSDENEPIAGTGQNLVQNEQREEHEHDQNLEHREEQEQQREEHEHDQNLDEEIREREEQEDGQNLDEEIGISQDASRAQDTNDSSDGAVQLKLIVPRSYQGISVLEGIDIHGFATANELREAINANDDCVTEGQVVGLLQNFPFFQLQGEDIPDHTAIRKGAVITIAEDARALFPVTTEYSTVGKILKEHGPKKLKISGVEIDKYWVKGNLWTRNRYTIDSTRHVYEWSALQDKEHVVSRRPRVSYADVIASNNRVVEAGADVVAASTNLANSINAASTNLANTINAASTSITSSSVKKV